MKALGRQIQGKPWSHIQRNDVVAGVAFVKPAYRLSKSRDPYQLLTGPSAKVVTVPLLYTD
jgi:hypothetical protein